ncbi:hypothetical protein D3C87_1332510 [compost metagenome]
MVIPSATSINAKPVLCRARSIHSNQSTPMPKNGSSEYRNEQASPSATPAATKYASDVGGRSARAMKYSQAQRLAAAGVTSQAVLA